MCKLALLTGLAVLAIAAGADKRGQQQAANDMPAANAVPATQPATATAPASPVTPETCRRAAEYSAAHLGVSMLVMVDGQVIFEDYANGGGKDIAWELASGTKSFWGVAAVAAAQDGLLDLDEHVADTITEWRDDPRAAQVTIRQLLGLVSGIDGGFNRGRVPTYEVAVQSRPKYEAGEHFSYGPLPYQIFGELLRRKLVAHHMDGDPLAYLRRRIFDPIGLHVTRWRRGSDGFPHLPSGAGLTAREWAKFGEFVRLGGKWGEQQIVPSDALDACFVGSSANPAYGLTWWLNRPTTLAQRRQAPMLARTIAPLGRSAGVPDDLVMAAGAGDQRLYVSRALHLVIVRQAKGVGAALLGRRSGYADAEFLRILLGIASLDKPEVE